MTKNVYSVGQVNNYIKNMFAQDFMLHHISIRGEVSNCKYHSSGHIYFTIKDDTGTMNAIMFAGNRRGLTFPMKEGDKVVVTGSVEVYERDGRYQVYARTIELDGAGNLYLKFEALKKELEEMGMFASEYKQPIPKYARTIGIVTAPTGAAIQDIRNIAGRRNPYVQLILYPSLVQGEGAASSIVNGIHAMERLGVDVIIVGRGGGSIEDLWAFNEEIVARAIFDCPIPVISAVGHQTDWTIADYVADLRAPTPSAAAELAVLDVRQILQQLDAAEEEMTRRMRRIIFTKRQALSQIHLQQQMEQLLRTKRNRLQQYQIHLRYLEPMQRVREQRQQIADVQEHLQRSMEQKILQDRNRIRLYAEQMRRCSPLDRLTQGYGLITDESGGRVHSVSQVKEGGLLNLYVSDGKITVQVQKIEQTDRE